MRTEQDLLGSLAIPADCYYGIHTHRSLQNFPITHRPIHPALVQAIVLVKKAAAWANLTTKQLPEHIAQAIMAACDQVLEGKLMDQFVVDGLQGGAGTSANMNVNEVLANLAIEILGGQKGQYDMVHPVHHVNLSQSTNDVFPTALRIAALQLLPPLSEAFAQLQTALQEKEAEFAHILKPGRTQLQDAVPVTLGQEFGAYAQAIARDRWRIYKVAERLRQVNAGGTAVGTGLNAHPQYIFVLTEKLRDLTGLGIARAEYLMDITQNADVFVEVSGLLKAAAVNLTKIANDLRLMASGPSAGLGEINLPPLQAGSTIMPGKVNPVIPEAVIQVAYQVMGFDLAITMAAQSGQLELNACLPLIAQNLLEAIQIITKAVDLFTSKCICGISANTQRCRELVDNSLVLITALVGHLGYDHATRLAQQASQEQRPLRELVLAEGLFTAEELDGIFDPFELTKPGIPGKR